MLPSMLRFVVLKARLTGARELAIKAAGILVFPSVVKGGIGIGGEYGEGLLIIRGRPGGYFNLVSASFGLQLGVQTRSVIIMFMTDEALASFQRTYGWRVGVGGSIAIATIGTGGSIDTERAHKPRDRVHSRSYRADVQLNPGRLKDQPHYPMTYCARAEQDFERHVRVIAIYADGSEDAFAVPQSTLDQWACS